MSMVHVLVSCVPHFLDARATQKFWGENIPAFLSEVRCTGSEEKLTACSLNRGPGDDRCDRAGVTCGKNGSENTQCMFLFKSYFMQVNGS